MEKKSYKTHEYEGKFRSCMWRESEDLVEMMMSAKKW